MNNSNNNAETPNQENIHKNLSNSLNNRTPKNITEQSENIDLKKSESLLKMEEQKENLEELKNQNNEKNPKVKSMNKYP